MLSHRPTVSCLHSVLCVQMCTFRLIWTGFIIQAHVMQDVVYRDVETFIIICVFLFIYLKKVNAEKQLLIFILFWIQWSDTFLLSLSPTHLKISADPLLTQWAGEEFFFPVCLQTIIENCSLQKHLIPKIRLGFILFNFNSCISFCNLRGCVTKNTSSVTLVL